MADGEKSKGVADADATPVSSIKPTRPPNKPLEMMLADLWRPLLDRPVVSVDDGFEELGGGPEQAARMLTALEQMIRRPIPNGAWRERLTIRNLTRAISDEAEKDARLVTCAREGQGRPFFFCHGDFSTHGFYALAMAERLGGQRPVYLLNPAFEIDGTAAMEQMATPYVDELVRLQPTGPIDLGGYCNGGLLAWEIAHQLRARGRELNRLILLDSTTINARRIYSAVARLLGGRRLKAMPQLWASAAQRRASWLDIARQMVETIAGRNLGLLPPATTRMARLEERVLDVLASYLLPSAPVHVDYVTAADGVAFFELQADPLRRLARSLSLHVVPGNHQTFVTTHVDALAEVLTNMLESPPPRPLQA